MRTIAKTVLCFILLACSGCGKAEISEARRDHILAEDHGWIDLTLSGDAPAGENKDDARCQIQLEINHESLLTEAVKYSKAEANQPLLGYRFPAPAGNLVAELEISYCVKDPVIVKLPISLEKNHLAKIRFDGKQMTLLGTTAYDPSTLDGLQSEVKKIQSSETVSSERLSTLMWLIIAVVVSNFFLLWLLLRKKGRA